MLERTPTNWPHLGFSWANLCSLLLLPGTWRTTTQPLSLPRSELFPIILFLCELNLFTCVFKSMSTQVCYTLGKVMNLINVCIQEPFVLVHKPMKQLAHLYRILRVSWIYVCYTWCRYYNIDIYHRRKMTKMHVKGMKKLAKKQSERTEFNDEEQKRYSLLLNSSSGLHLAFCVSWGFLRTHVSCALWHIRSCIAHI